MPALSQTESAIRRLYLYNLLLSAALTVASNFTLIDRLLLRLEINLEFFGAIKCLMYLLPAIAYQLLAPRLQRLNRDVGICLLCYFLRLLLPTLLPFVAIFCHDHRLVSLACFVLLPMGMLFAAFANNSLMALYYRIVPESRYNYCIGMMNMFFSLPAIILAIPIAWVLDRFDGLSTPRFLLLFGAIQIGVALFEFPAFFVLRRLPVPPPPTAAKTAANPLEPYRHRSFRTLAALMFTHRLAAGLAMAYLTVYFLKVLGLSLTHLTTIGLVLCLLMNLALPYGGKVMDRFGYTRVFLLLTVGMAAGYALFAWQWQRVWVILPFAILAWDGALSLFAGLLIQGEYTASTRLAQPQWINSAIAAHSIACNGGYFCGLFAASALFHAVKRLSPGAELSVLLHTYYWLVVPCFLLTALLAWRLRRTAGDI